ncbi:MAG: universal stress protein [Nitrospirae bacterium]|nr:universal stress protein [Nitrospirota bacterium]MBI3352703.1 universal stress protein [Nitrospirota bacterium]
MHDVKIKKILVPTDFSAYSEAAKNYALGLAKVFRSKLFLLHVQESIDYFEEWEVSPLYDPYELKKKFLEMIDKEVEIFKTDGIDAEGLCIAGVPSLEIIKAAKKYEIDLIVMGTHGRKGIPLLLLGSTAERVIQQAEPPVLTIKSPKKILTSPLIKESDLEKKINPAEIEILKGHPESFCHLCGQPSEEIICNGCKFRVQAEAFEQKRRVEKEGKTDTGKR